MAAHCQQGRRSGQSAQHLYGRFDAGLLHDIGIMLEGKSMHELFSEMMMALPEGKTLIQVERKCFGFDHTILGDQVAGAWHLPVFVQMAIRLHHNPGVGYGGEHGKLLACVELAHALCTLKNISSIGVKRIKLSPTGLDCLGLVRGGMRVITEDMDRELATSRIFEHR